MIVLIYWEITPTVEDFTRSIGPYIVGEFILWLSYYIYQKQSFQYLKTEYMMPIAGKESRLIRKEIAEDIFEGDNALEFWTDFWNDV